MVVEMLKEYWGYKPGTIVNVSPMNARRWSLDGTARLYVKSPEKKPAATKKPAAAKQTESAPKNKMTTGAAKTK